MEGAEGEKRGLSGGEKLNKSRRNIAPFMLEFFFVDLFVAEIIGT